MKTIIRKIIPRQQDQQEFERTAIAWSSREFGLHRQNLKLNSKSNQKEENSISGQLS